MLSVINSYHFEIPRIFQRFFIIRNLFVIFSQIGNVYGNKCNEVTRKRGNEETRKRRNEVTIFDLNLQFPSLLRYFATSFPRYMLSVINSYHFEIPRIFQRFIIIRNLFVIFSQIGNVYGNKCNEVTK